MFIGKGGVDDISPQIKGGLHLKPPKFEHIFVAA